MVPQNVGWFGNGMVQDAQPPVSRSPDGIDDLGFERA